MDDNNFNNSFLSSLSGIASLKELDLSNNNLNGSIHIQGKIIINLQMKIEECFVVIENVIFSISLISIVEIYANKFYHDF